MRIDRRGNPGCRKIPTFSEMEGSTALTGNRKSESDRTESKGGQGEDSFGSVPSSPSDAFSDLERTEGGLVKNVISILAAVGRALKEIKQGSSRSYD